MDADWLEAVLKRHERDNRVEKVTGIEFKSAAPKGQNYLGVTTRATCDVVLQSGRKTKKSLIIKKEHQGKRKDVTKNMSLFRVEIKMFQNVLTKMENLMDEFIDKNDLLWGHMIACEEYTTIVLEDLTELGYSVAKRQDCLDYDHSSLVLKSLARFHAMSKILMHRGQITNNDCGILGFLSYSNLSDNFVIGGLNQLVDAIRNFWPDKWKEMGERIEKETMHVFKKLVLLAKKEFDNEFKVVNHGDAWTCNMMFKYSHDGKTPISMKFIDFQNTHYKSFAWDITYFLSTSVRPDVRRNAYAHLMKVYWESLDATLRFYGYDERIPSYVDVIEAMNRVQYYSFYGISLLQPFMTAECTDAFDIEKIVENDTSKSAFNPMIFKSGIFFKHAGEDFEMFANKGLI